MSSVILISVKGNVVHAFGDVASLNSYIAKEKLTDFTVTTVPYKVNTISGIRHGEGGESLVLDCGLL